MNNSIVKLSPELLSIIGHGTEMSLQPFSREIFLLEITVAGTSYRDEIYDVEPLLKKGTIVVSVEDVDSWVKVKGRIYMVE